MPTAARHTGSRHPDEQTIALIDLVWGRLQARLEKGLSLVERHISALFDRPLERDERIQAVGVCDALASKLGMLSLGATAELIRKAAVIFEQDELDHADAIALSAILDDVRVAMATSVVELKQISHTDHPLAVVGPVCEIVDELLWVAAAQGLPVAHHVDGVSSTNHEAAAVLVVVDDPDLGRARPMLRGVREVHDHQPILVLAPPGRLEDRARIADTVTSILPSVLRPSEVIDEVRRELIRARQPMTVAVLGDGADDAVDVLRVRGLDARAVQSVSSLLGSLRNGERRAVVLTPSGASMQPFDVLRVIRADRETRGTVVILVGDVDAGDSSSSALRAGADHFFDLGLDPDELAVVLKSRLVRRAQLEPVVDPIARLGVVAWPTATVLIERLLLTAFRQNMPVGIGLLQLPADDSNPELDDEIAREFRSEDVISRVADDLLVIALQGAGRRILLRRLADIHRKFGLDERQIRSVGIEFPVDGRSLDELLDVGRGCLSRASEDGAPMIVGADWQQWLAEAPDVMLIDPDRTLGNVLSATLNRRGLKVVHRPDALEAVAELTGAAAGTLPRVVLMELDQRGIDGLQMLRQLRESGGLGRYRVIVLSSRNQERELQQAFDLGAYDFVPKPFSTPLLLHRLNRALDH